MWINLALASSAARAASRGRRNTLGTLSMAAMEMISLEQLQGKQTTPDQGHVSRASRRRQGLSSGKTDKRCQLACQPSLLGHHPVLGCGTQAAHACHRQCILAAVHAAAAETTVCTDSPSSELMHTHQSGQENAGQCTLLDKGPWQRIWARQLP